MYYGPIHLFWILKDKASVALFTTIISHWEWVIGSNGIHQPRDRGLLSWCTRPDTNLSVWSGFDILAPIHFDSDPWICDSSPLYFFWVSSRIPVYLLPLNPIVQPGRVVLGFPITGFQNLCVFSTYLIPILKYMGLVISLMPKLPGGDQTFHFNS